MKKTLLAIIIMLSFSSFVFGQNIILTVSGYLNDVSNNQPVVGYPVNIAIDSTYNGAFFYYNTVNTDTNGFYADTIQLPPAMTQGYVTVSTVDYCTSSYVSQTGYFNPGNYNLTFDFDLCQNGGDCQANFFARTDSMNTFIYYFYDTSLGIHDSWLWEFGDGQSSTEQNPIHTYNATGVYYVCLTISDSSGACLDTYCSSILVAGNPGGGCENSFTYTAVDSLTFTFYGEVNTTDSTVFFWDFGDNTTGYGQVITHTFQPMGAATYQVCLYTTSYDSLGQICEDESCQIVTIGTVPPQGCSNDFTYTYVDSLTLTFTGEVYYNNYPFYGQSLYYWDFGDGTTGEGQTITHTFPAGDSIYYYVCLTTISMDSIGDSCQAVSCQYVRLGNTPGNCQSWFNYTLSGLSVAFTGHTFSPYSTTYDWSFGDGTSGTGQNISHVYGSTGIYTVALATEDSTGCSWAYTGNIIVGDTMYYNITGTVFLENQTYADVGNVYLMLFDTMGVNLVTVDTTTIGIDGSYLFENFEYRTYYIQAELTDGSVYFGQYLPTYHLSSLFWQGATLVIPNPASVYDIYMITNTNYNSGIGEISGTVNNMDTREVLENVEILLLGPDQEPYTYQKTNQDGQFEFNDLALETYQIYTEIPGIITTPAIITLDNIHPTSNIQIIIKNGHAYLSVDDLNPVDISGVGEIYPNPVTNNALIRISSIVEAKVQLNIINQLGQTITTKKLILNQGINQIELNTSGLPGGLYNLRIMTENNSMILKRFIKY
ncbi:MAG: PKD domain-containing protein [Bacteroidetes bacterium]|nr:PKD domain-containing protein [Bacteroidota bacterium]